MGITIHYFQPGATTGTTLGGPVTAEQLRAVLSLLPAGAPDATVPESPEDLIALLGERAADLRITSHSL